MRIHIASDHAGFDLKDVVSTYLRDAGHDVVDHGALRHEPLDDYPEFCFAASEAVVGEIGSLGVVIGGSGNGEQIAANKVSGVRAALGWNVETATLARTHNDANVLGIGARMHDEATACAIVEAFIATPFSGDVRHQRRIDQVTAYERSRG